MTTAEQHPEPSEPPPGAVPQRPLALITGVGRTIGIGAGIARRLAASGWDIAFTYWTPYDRRMAWGEEQGASAAIDASLAEQGARTAAIEADLSDPDAPARVFDEAERRIGPVTALVLSHAESVDSGLLDTTVESFDRHFAVNTRATWLLIREYGLRFRAAPGSGRIVALTSDHTVGNLPYGASKGALDRITLAAAHEFAHLKVTAKRHQPRPRGHRLDERRALGTRPRRHPAGAPGHPAGHRAPGGLPLLSAGPVDQRPATEEQRRIGVGRPAGPGSLTP